MKKISRVILVLFLFVIVVIYLFIPSRINFSKVIYIQHNVNSTNRIIYDESNWSKWWPGFNNDNLIKGLNNGTYRNKNYSYTINRKMPEGLNIMVENNNRSVLTFMHVIAINTDSVAIEWKGEIAVTYNPIKKISNYIFAKGIQSNMAEIVNSAKLFLESYEKVYGLEIVQQKVKDTLLLSTRIDYDLYPGTETIYQLIDSLKQYISFNNARENNYPMLNITKDNKVFKTMIAIPINKAVPENEKYILKRMVPGKILVAEVKGGAYSTRKALMQIETYMIDHHLLSPALPFESLVVDRSKEPDTAKWVTKIFYPVM